jgi:DNA polymerase-3 subunit delta'
MSAPEPRANPLLLGQEPAEVLLLEALRSRRMHHAWLITGPEGVGKATLAYRLARRLLAGPPATGEDSLAVSAGSPVFRRVAAGSHADLMTVELAYDTKRKRMKTQIAVEDVRGIAHFMSLTPAEGGWRVVVVDGAEELNANSANALLKVLEEPPPRAILLLVCGAPGRLLPTIRSRCRRLQLSALDDASMGTLLADYLPEMPPDERDRLITLAEGSPGRALLLAEEHGLALATLVDEALSASPNLKISRAYEMADAITRGEGAFSTFMDLLRAAITSAVRDAVRGRGDPDQMRLVATRPLDAWGEVWEALTRLQDETERFNLDKRQAIVAGLAMLGQQNSKVVPS